jgi:hypothetical protein
MRFVLAVAGISLILTASPAGAYYCENGQLPAPPEVAARMALPLCGFAATKRFGPNGCQLCDARNMHPGPYDDGPDGRDWRRARTWRDYR